eukprot:GEMP01046443.1.p1 GENE.GEMP01046443.1~~GEMP01046443.1.p1  ORF type:complete len:213 (+),score=42.33 GEMP01046443.1:57-641(+)
MAGLVYPTAQGMSEFRRPPIPNPYSDAVPETMPSYDRKIFRRLKKVAEGDGAEQKGEPPVTRTADVMNHERRPQRLALVEEEGEDDVRSNLSYSTRRSNWSSTVGAERPRTADAYSTRRRKGDVVSLGQSYRALWTGDKFLQNGKRKFDIKSRENSGRFLLQQRNSVQARPSYVPPHEKRRDELRLYIREQMRR